MNYFVLIIVRVGKCPKELCCQHVGNMLDILIAKIDMKLLRKSWVCYVYATTT